ncbi:unnamed protein product [Coccothraustes coccothraustes]
MAPAPLAVEQRCSLLGSRGWVAALRLLRFRGKNGVPGLRRALGVLTVERNACAVTSTALLTCLVGYVDSSSEYLSPLGTKHEQDQVSDFVPAGFLLH